MKVKTHHRTQQEEKEWHYQQLFPEYEPIYSYSVFFINRCSTEDELDYLIHYAALTTKFMIDVESDWKTYEPALIQIYYLNAVHDKSPLLLIEIKHFPSQSSNLLEKIRHLFNLIFRLDTEIYGWGNVQEELTPFNKFNVLPSPLLSTLHDTQKLFRIWFNKWLNDQTIKYNAGELDNNIILVHNKYDPLFFLPPDIINELKMNRNEKWSLQDAIAYLFQQHLSKQYTLRTWSCGLDSRLLIKHPIYSYNVQTKMINYAQNDVLALAQVILFISRSSVTDLSSAGPSSSSSRKLPAEGQSSFKKLSSAIRASGECKPQIDLNTFSKALGFSDDDSSSSSSEIFMHQTVTVHEKNERHSNQPAIAVQLPPSKHITTTTNEKIEVESSSPPRRQKMKHQLHRNRSLEAKKRRNKKSSMRHRRNRYNYEVVRPVNMSISLVKQKLKQHHIKYININIVRARLYIGLKSAQHQQQYEQSLAMDMFL